MERLSSNWLAWTALALAFAPCLSGQAQAQVSGPQLLEACQTAIRGIDGADQNATQLVLGGQCIGYMIAASDFTKLLHALGFEAAVCFPDGVSPAQMARVVVKFIEEHPERLHEGPPSLVAAAFKAAFPACPSGDAN